MNEDQKKMLDIAAGLLPCFLNRIPMGDYNIGNRDVACKAALLAAQSLMSLHREFIGHDKPRFR